MGGGGSIVMIWAFRGMMSTRLSEMAIFTNVVHHLCSGSPKDLGHLAPFSMAEPQWPFSYRKPTPAHHRTFAHAVTVMSNGIFPMVSFRLS